MLLFRAPLQVHVLFISCFVTPLIVAAPPFSLNIFASSLLVTQAQDIQEKGSSLEIERHNSAADVHVDEVESLLLSPLWSTPATTLISFDSLAYQYPFSFSFMTGSSNELLTNLITATTTITVIEEEPITVTVSEAPIIETRTIFVTVLPSSSTSVSGTPISSTSTQPSSPSTNPSNGLSKTTWAAPADMTDLSAFQVSKFAGGKNNLKIVSSVPFEASRISSEDDSPPGSSAIQLFYPANSIDPAQKPQGGTEFYASPIDITSAENVTLTYSVFFPKDFNWVLAGKLPGLYGGHTGCSGGNAALDCFSTRLMWRREGAGELYLYAPKDKQTKALCSDTQSVCDEEYGLSVGRGSFHWEPGAWTTVKQTVSLNTPGKQDGEFSLDVNGKRAIYRNDVFYRENLNEGGARKTTKTSKTIHTTRTRTKTKTRKLSKPITTATDTSSTNDGGVLGPLLSEILGGLRRRHFDASIDRKNKRDVWTTNTAVVGQHMTSIEPRPTATNPGPTMTSSNLPAPTTTGDDTAFGIESIKETDVKFSGIFFSTFFGGHEAEYATPEDQYAWFKDFALEVNS